MDPQYGDSEGMGPSAESAIMRNVTFGANGKLRACRTLPRAESVLYSTLCTVGGTSRDIQGHPTSDIFLSLSEPTGPLLCTACIVLNIGYHTYRTY